MTRAKDISKVITAPVLSGLTYPATDGSANQFMKTDGSGALSFATVDLTALSATNLTSGTIPSARVSGAYTGITSVGTLTGFTSTGIDDNANALAITIDSSENVAIGKSVPLSKLDVTGGFITVSKDANTSGRIGASEYITGSTANDLIVQATGSAITRFYQSGVNSLNIDASGNVGIGGTPTANLHVYRATGDASLIIETGEDSGASEPTLYLKSYATNANPAIRFGDRLANNGFIEYENNDDSLRFGTNASERMLITSAGNVGIGNSNPEDFGSLVDNLVIGTTSGENGMTIVSGTANSGRIQFADNTSSPFRGAIEYAHGSTDALLFYTAGSQHMKIDSSGRLGIGTSSARAKLTVAMDAASSDGIALDNANGGATMDISLLGTGYNAHGAASGEVWIYSPDNINIGGATGSGNHIKFLGNNAVRMLIHGSKPQVDYHGVKEYYYSGSLANSTIVVNIDISGVSNAGVMLVQATFNHYSINAYGAARTSNLGLYGGGLISTHDIQNISSGNGGSWSYSTPTNGTIRITKNAGTYAGGGYYWVKVTTYI